MRELILALMIALTPFEGIVNTTCNSLYDSSVDYIVTDNSYIPVSISSVCSDNETNTICDIKVLFNHRVYAIIKSTKVHINSSKNPNEINQSLH